MTPPRGGCGHEHVYGLTWGGDGVEWMYGGDDARRCWWCGHWLSLGPSDEPPVAVEIRAAEIADDLQEADRLCDWTFARFGDDDERRGWSIAETNMQRHSDRYQSGYLARCIVEHDDPVTPRGRSK